MAFKKIRITNRKERAILSDVLPYEIPVAYSNRHLYSFFIENGIEIKDHNLEWRRSGRSLNKIIELLLGIKIATSHDTAGINRVAIPQNQKDRIPFIFTISHKSDSFRELAVVHPFSQLQLINFYDKYKELLLYYSAISSYSIRYPCKLAEHSYYKDRLFAKSANLDNLSDAIEESHREYDNLKTFFAYAKYSNIYKFYESDQYHACEKKYDRLYKFDISKCFDSIYTHSISWATLTKEAVKQDINASKRTFGGRFDELMTKLNYNETNGIVIGPEFSRIFAEIILQRIDRDVQTQLSEEGLENGTDYAVFRYVDDYFVFYNKPRSLASILRLYKLKLRDYKLYISDSKSLAIEKPLITQISIAKQRIGDLFNDFFRFELRVNRDGDVTSFSHSVSAKRLIARFKSIVKETGIVYRDILNYTLACVDKRVESLIKNYIKYSAHRNESSDQRRAAAMIIEALEFAFFIYAVSPRVSITVKLCMILDRVVRFLNGGLLSGEDSKDAIRHKINQDIISILSKHRTAPYAQVETLYLLLAHKQLGVQYLIEEELLASYLLIDLKKRKFCQNPNFWCITELLLYIEDEPQYSNIKAVLKETILGKFHDAGEMRMAKDTELCMLFFDLIVCPFLDRKFKNKLFQLADVEDDDLRTAIINERKHWFTQWTSFHYSAAIMQKKSKEVY